MRLEEPAVLPTKEGEVEHWYASFKLRHLGLAHPEARSAKQ